ncbi:hypothetical protein [Streptomyces asoensis]|uniref:hypothetical protein n=1 Tax=Streptomyces asoensis TaxID=249586 RepID=UPI003409D850
MRIELTTRAVATTLVTALAGIGLTLPAAGATGPATGTARGAAHGASHSRALTT